jgi:hypothetical protein
MSNLFFIYKKTSPPYIQGASGIDARTQYTVLDFKYVLNLQHYTMIKIKEIFLTHNILNGFREGSPLNEKKMLQMLRNFL